jgi:hypothetical protein
MSRAISSVSVIVKLALFKWNNSGGENRNQIIDEIDSVLAEHYGFSDEELDFIINYDIKYRMRGDIENVEE